MELSHIKSSITLDKVLPISEFITKFHDDDITHQGIMHAIEKDKIDYIRLGKNYFVVLTDLTTSYTRRKAEC